jgi:hypothetical protein
MHNSSSYADPGLKMRKHYYNAATTNFVIDLYNAMRFAHQQPFCGLGR